jgi:adenosylcobyric acid synthase
MKFFRDQGWDIDLLAHHRRGGHVLGICGGYQMLGRHIDDPDGVDGAAGSVEGLGLLDVRTVMQSGKTVRQTRAYCPPLDCSATGYEIHVGTTNGADEQERPFLQIDGRNAGACSPDGIVAGGYMHGLFDDDDFRARYLAPFRSGQLQLNRYGHRVDKALDALADAMEEHLDIDALWQAMST